MHITAFIWLFGTFALIALLFATVASFASNVRKRGWSAAMGKALKFIVLAGIVAFFLPYVLSAENMGNALEGVAVSAYSLLLTVSVQAPTGEVIEVAHKALEPLGYSWLASVYGVFVNILAFAMPFVVVTTAIGRLRQRLQHLKFWILRKDHRVVYVFSDVNDTQVALARDILLHREEAAHMVAMGEPKKDVRNRVQGTRPLIVFCEMDEQRREDKSTLIQDIRDQGKGDVILVEDSMCNLVGELSKFDNIYCFVFGDEHAHNVEKTAELINRICSESANALVSGNGNELEIYAHKFSVYCTHESQEDELVFDSLAQRDPTPRNRPEYAGLSSDELRGLQERMQITRSNIEVRLVSLTQERVFGVLTQHPLYDVLDPLSLTAQTDVKPQELWVVIVGLGRNGLEALKTTYWMGRLRGVSLHILGIDARGRAITEELQSTCPEMMAELDEDKSPVVRIVEARTFTPSFTHALQKLPRSARIYAMVTLGDDQLDLNVALALRRTFDNMILTGALKDRGTKNPMVLPLINAHETFNAAERMSSDRQESFDITPFGQTDDVFSFQNIVVAPWEHYAMSMNGAYDEVWAKDKPNALRGTSVYMDFDTTAREYSEYEIKKLSNRTSTRHIPYRLWSLGFNPSLHFDDAGSFVQKDLTNERWHRALGLATAHDADLLLHPQNKGSNKETKAKLDRLRKTYPIVCALADLEHDRWVAFYRSQGWRDLTIEECQKLVDMGVISKLSVHQSPKLRRHCYLCNTNTLLERGVALNDDPFVYDRAAIVETQRILSGSIFQG